MPEKLPRPVHGFWTAIGALIMSIIVVTYVLRTTELGLPARLGLAVVPAIAFGVYLLFLARSIAQLDEMQRRIHLEALAVAFPTLALGVFACEYLRKADVLDSLKPDHVLAMMMVVLFLGYAVAFKRYQ